MWMHSCLPGYKDVSSANCAKSRLRSNNFITTVWWKAVFNAIGFFRRLRTPRGDLVGLGKGLSRLCNLLCGDKGKSSPAYLSTNLSAVLNAPDSLERAELTSAKKNYTKMSNYRKLCHKKNWNLKSITKRTFLPIMQCSTWRSQALPL